MKPWDYHRIAFFTAMMYRAVIRTPGGRELLEEKKRQLRQAGVLKDGGENNAILQDLSAVRIEP